MGSSASKSSHPQVSDSPSPSSSSTLTAPTTTADPTDMERHSSGADPPAPPVETPGVKQVEVLAVHNPEDYEDNTNQTGVSHYEMKIIDSFYSAPERNRGKAYNDAKLAASEKKANRASKKDKSTDGKDGDANKNTSKRKLFRRSRNSSNADNNPPDAIDKAMEDTKKLGILNLSKHGLSAIPDKVFESLPGTCRFIILSSNNLAVLDERLCDYVLVQRLTADYNVLTSLPPTISRMTALKKLDLANNRLTTLPDAFASMKLLEYIDLSNNELTALPPSFETLNLTMLKLGHNQFSQLPSQIFAMTLLMDLDVSHNSITHVPTQLTSLENLISFNLDNNRLSDFSNEILLACTALVTLRLHSNPITLQTLQEKPAFQMFQQRQKLKLKRQLDAGSISPQDLIPTD